MKTIYSIALLFVASLQLQAQEKLAQDYVLLEGQDTIFCSVTQFFRLNGVVSTIEYVDENNNSVVLKKKECRNVTSIRIWGKTFDRVPLKPGKSNSELRLITRKYSGSIMFYSYCGFQCYMDGEEKKYNVSTCGVIEIIRLPDGTYYKRSPKSIENILAPFVLKCDAFKDQFSKEVNKSNFEGAIVLYNKVCI